MTDGFELPVNAGAVQLAVTLPLPLVSESACGALGSPSSVVRQVGADTVLELAGGRLTLRGVRAATLPPGWLFFR